MSDRPAAISTAHVYRRALAAARPYGVHLLGLLVLTLLSTPLALLAPFPLKIVIDSVLGSEPPPAFLQTVLPDAALSTPDRILVVAVALVLLVAVASQLRNLVKNVLKTYTGQRLVLDVRARLFDHAQRLSLTYHDRRGTSDSVYRIHNDASAVKTLALDGVIPFVGSAATVVGMLWITASIDPQLALVALLVAPALFTVLRLYAARLRGGWHGVQQLDSSIMAVVAEALAGARLVKSSGQEDRESRRYVRRGAEKVQARTRLALHESGLGLLIGLIMAFGTAAVLYLGARSARAGTLTPGDLTLVMAYLTQLYAPLQRVSERIGEVQSSLVSAERAFALLDEAPDVVERADARRLRRATGSIAFERLSFAYDGSADVLHDVTFQLEPGTRLGIAGPTGAGKSTLVSLLVRFFDPTDGRILLDGVDLRDYRVADLRNQFAIVLQEPVLFSASVADNIAYARPDASNAEIVAAARAASAHDFVSALPDGYDTLLGERGMRLSGGERQRVSLARAFLRDAPILVLDEPTSALDTTTEAVIMQAMDRLMVGRTVLMIAHRLGTLESCEAQLVLDEGRLVEVSAGVR